MSYGEGVSIEVARYTNNKNIAILLGEGRYDVLTTNGELPLGEYCIGIRSDEPHKIAFAVENNLILSEVPLGFEPSGYININHYYVTNKVLQMLEEWDRENTIAG